MDKRAYLVANDNPDPAGPYDPRTEILACARFMVPAFWLSGFSSCHITERRISDFLGEYRVPSAVAETSVVKTLVAERYGLLAKAFSQFGPNLEEWKKLVDGVAFKYVKVDATELWSFDRKTFTSQFPAAIRWLEPDPAASWDRQAPVASSMAAYRKIPRRHRPAAVGRLQPVNGKHHLTLAARLSLG